MLSMEGCALTMYGGQKPVQAILVQRSCSGLSTVLAYKVSPVEDASTWPNSGLSRTWTAASPGTGMPGRELVAEGAGAAAWVLAAGGAGLIPGAAAVPVEGLQAARTRDRPMHILIHPGLPISGIKRFIRNLLPELARKNKLPIHVVDEEYARSGGVGFPGG